MATGDLEYYLANNPFYVAGVSSARNNANLDYSRMSPLEAALAGFVSGAGTGALTSYGRSQAQEDYNNDYNSYREAMNSYLTTGDTSLIDALQGGNPFSQKAQNVREQIELKNLENSLAPKDKSKVMVSGAILNQYIGADVYDSNEEYPVSHKDLKTILGVANGGSKGESESKKGEYYTKEQAIALGLPEEVVDKIADEDGEIPVKALSDYKKLQPEDKKNKLEGNNSFKKQSKDFENYNLLKDYTNQIGVLIGFLNNALSQKKGQLSEFISLDSLKESLDKLAGIKSSISDKTLDSGYPVIIRSLKSLQNFITGNNDLSSKQNRAAILDVKRQLQLRGSQYTNMLRRRLETTKNLYKKGRYNTSPEKQLLVEEFLLNEGVDIDNLGE